MCGGRVSLSTEGEMSRGPKQKGARKSGSKNKVVMCFLYTALLSFLSTLSLYFVTVLFF